MNAKQLYYEFKYHNMTGAREGIKGNKLHMKKTFKSIQPNIKAIIYSYGKLRLEISNFFGFCSWVRIQIFKSYEVKTLLCLHKFSK